LAEDSRLRRKVALKLLPARFTQDAERVRRFEQEAQAASALNHPNIITIHEIGQSDDLHYIVTEYIEGQTLRQQLDEQRGVSCQRCLRPQCKAASALNRRARSRESLPPRHQARNRLMLFSSRRLGQSP
jgi:serine/threonine-protein kinase